MSFVKIGTITNIAAITEDYNEKNVDDVDSIPGNEDIPDYDIEIEKIDNLVIVNKYYFI